MEQRNSVAIIIPTYNRSALLTRALRTVDSQSIENLRIIVVDDGSTDATPDVMSRLCRQDARIVYQQTDHVGVATARNVGLDLAKGAKYIGFLDSDDQWLPEHLKTSIAALEANPDVGLTFAQIQTIDDTGTWTPRRAAARDSRATKAL